MTAVPPALPDTAQNKRLKESHEFTRLLLGKADMRVDQTNTSNENHIPFIVRADESTSDILFQTSDTTWHAYNGWGGANLYGGNGPGGDSSPGRAYKVSYDRPIATRDGVGTYSGPQDFLFGAEFAAIFWLEQNGYDVSYIAGVDTARFPSLLRQHRIFTSTGH
jgi:hypothetical protein